MTLASTVAVIMFLGVIAYAVFAGADFGSGVWDLTAGDAKRGAPMRTLIDHSIGPVWEANHVWLIFVLVFMWTGFPTAFATICEVLFLPLTFAGFGIVLRGSAFAFRKFAPSIAQARLFGAMFATSSIVTPFILGGIAGAVASGRVAIDRPPSSWAAWLHPTSIVGGILAVLTCAFLAAVFLTADAAKQGRLELVEQCRRRAIGAGIATGVAALIGIWPLERDAPTLFHGLNHRALPLILLSGIGGAGTIWLLIKRRPRYARITAVVAVASVVAGWGVAQWPFILVDELKIEDAAGARQTLWGLVLVLILAAVTVLPSLIYLLWFTERPEPMVSAGAETMYEPRGS